MASGIIITGVCCRLVAFHEGEQTLCVTSGRVVPVVVVVVGEVVSGSCSSSSSSSSNSSSSSGSNSSPLGPTRGLEHLKG